MRNKGEWEEMERSVRLERSCAEDEEVSEEGKGARWHGTYEYPRRLQQWGEGKRERKTRGVATVEQYSDGHDCSTCRLYGTRIIHYKL